MATNFNAEVQDDICFTVVPYVTPELAAELRKHTNTYPTGSGFKNWLSFHRDELLVVIVSLGKEPGGKIIGWSAFLDSMYSSGVGVFIDPEYRRRGIGTLAFDRLLLAMKQDGRGTTSIISYDDTSVMAHIMAARLPLFGFSTSTQAA